MNYADFKNKDLLLSRSHLGAAQSRSTHGVPLGNPISGKNEELNMLKEIREEEKKKKATC